MIPIHVKVGDEILVRLRIDAIIDGRDLRLSTGPGAFWEKVIAHYPQQLSIGDPVRSPSTDEEGEVFGVTSDAIAVRWRNGGSSLFSPGELERV